LSAGAAAAALELEAGPTYGVDLELDAEDGALLGFLTLTGTSDLSVDDADGTLELERGPMYGTDFEVDVEDGVLDFLPAGACTGTGT
jgi:hypothetical protein